jgi:argininosuccinate lyase
MAGKLWGGRFTRDEMDPKVMDFTSSLDVDRVLARHDCVSTRVHVEMLEKCGYMSAQERKAITAAIDELLGLISSGKVDYSGHEDIHSLVQAFVEKKAPEAAGKMHTGRSRNEQVVNDVRLYCKEMMDSVSVLIEKLQGAFVSLAGKNAKVIMPGYTHMNHAQPVLFSHLLLSYVEMLERDKGRIQDAKKRCDISVMGSGALAGSALDLDRGFTAKKLGFSKVSANSMDSVSDRDFMAEFMSAMAIIGVHLSRIAEDLILYSIIEFKFIEMGEDYCTGSSLMPQKKNADVLELIRGRASVLISGLNALLILLKGLPHTYNRDLQEDKRFLFASVSLVIAELDIMAELVPTIAPDAGKMAAQLEDEFIYSTDIAEYLVGKGVAFRDAHSIAGGIVKYCAGKGMNISDLSLAELKGFSAKLDQDIYGYLKAETSVKMKKTYGSTNPKAVEKEIAGWKNKLGLK